MFLNGEKDRLVSKNASCSSIKYIFLDLLSLSIPFFWLRYWGNNLLILEYEGRLSFRTLWFFVFVLIAEVKTSSACHYHPWVSGADRPTQCGGIWPLQSTYIYFNIQVHSANKMPCIVATLHLPDSCLRSAENYNTPNRECTEYFRSHGELLKSLQSITFFIRVLTYNWTHS